MAYHKRFKEVVKNKYKRCNHTYTDGYKSVLGVVAAATIGNRTKFVSLTKLNSNFTTETYEIHLALNTISATKGKPLLYSQTQEAAYERFRSKFRSK